MKIGILGTGAYGMALASIFDYNKCNIMMWTNSKEEMELLLRDRKSNKIDYTIPNNISISNNIEAMPGKYLRRVGPDKGGFWEIIK
jgi:glycerol-3-phosphate dehydrogenase